MNENELYVVKEHRFNIPLITDVDSIMNSCFKDCHNTYFHNFNYKCIYDIKLKTIIFNENITLKFSAKSMNLYDLIKKIKIATQNAFIFNQINKLKINFYSHLRYINISYYLKFQIPMCHRQFFRVISQNRDYVEISSNDLDNPFHFASQNWSNQLK